MAFAPAPMTRMFSGSKLSVSDQKRIERETNAKPRLRSMARPALEGHIIRKATGRIERTSHGRNVSYRASIGNNISDVFTCPQAAYDWLISKKCKVIEWSVYFRKSYGPKNSTQS